MFNRFFILKFISISETKLTIEVHTTVIQSSLRCLPNFSCAQKCDFGYRSGDNGCPTCECLIRLTGINLSRVVRKPAFCICENKDADQLRGNREADQRLCFRYTDSTIPLLPESEISSL